MIFSFHEKQEIVLRPNPPPSKKFSSTSIKRHTTELIAVFLQTMCNNHYPMSSLTGRCDYGNHSVLDGYIVEEIFTHFRALIVQIVAAINDLIVAKRLVETLLYGCIQFVSERLRRRKCIRLLFPFIRFAKKQHYRRKDADVSDSQYIRYSFDQYLPSSSVVRDREFGEAFLTASQRLIYRWSYKLLGDEILLRQRLTAFKLARTRYFDLKFEQAIKQQKVEQIIILGAGFDTRGFRFEALRREYCSHNQGVQQRELVLHRQDGDVKKLFVDFSTTKASSNHEEFGDRDSQEQSSELNLLGEASSCYESLCSPSPKLCSSSQADCHHINVIELDSPEVQRQKIKFLLKHFPYSEAVKFSEGVLFVGCDFHDPQCLDSALDGSLLDPNRKTLIIAEGLMSTLKVEVVEGIFRSLRDFMLTSIEKKHDILQNESLMTSKTPTHCKFSAVCNLDCKKSLSYINIFFF